MDMITEDLIRTEFVHQVMERDINRIYQTQENVVATYLQTRSGALLRSLQQRPFRNVSSGGGREVYHMRIFPYLRFLDIKYRRGRTDRVSRHIRSKLALYNRVVWGVLYHETFPELTHGFTEQVRTRIRGQLERAFGDNV